MFLRLGKPFQFVSFLSLLMLAGCGSSGVVDGKYPLKGTVQFQGTPIAQGTIEISASDQTLGTGAPIKDGAFEIEAARGLPPGTYTVRISSVEGGAAPAGDAPPGESVVTGVEKIPAQYNVSSKLTVEVKADLEANQTLTFDLK